MNTIDLNFLQNAQRRPGRSILFSFLCIPYIGTVTDPGGGATQSNLLLPAPSVGFVRQWDLINGAHSVPATGNFIALFCLPPGVPASAIGNATPMLARISFLTGYLPATFQPLVGGMHIVGTANGPQQLMGLDPVLVGPGETLMATFSYTAASGASLSVQGRYCDFPI